MADNVLRKPAAAATHKTPADGQMPPARKISAPVHRTTTETIRLGEPLDSPGRNHHHHGQSLGSIPIPTGNSTPNTANSTGGGGGQGRTKKTSSFQITSVTVGCRMSNDAGEDSNDDLDESHTEDNSVDGHSRLTDIETPSYSEDTFSKDDVFFNASNAALSTAPVIPTSSQYGLAIVPSSEANNASSAANDSNINTLDIASVTDNNIINLLSSNVKQDADLREVHSHGRNERFKVVKIESTEPFKRGRWTCMDYLDHTSVNQPTAISTPKVSDPNEVCISYGVTNTGIVIPDKQQQVVDDKGMTMDANGPIHPEQQQQQQHPSVGYTVQTPQQQQQQQQPQQQQQQVPPQYFQSSSSQTGQPSGQQQQQQQQTGGQGTTLPTNLQSAHPNSMPQTQSMPQGAIPILTQQGCPVSQTNNVPAQQSQQQQQTIAHPQDDTTYVPVNSQGQTMQSQAQQQAQPSSQTAPSIIVPQQQPTSQGQQPESMQGMQGMQSIHTVPSQTGAAATSQQQQQLQPQSQVMAPTGQMQPGQPQQQQQATTAGGAPVQVVGGMAFQQQQQQQQQSAPTQQQPDPEQDSMAGMVAGAGGPTAGQSGVAPAESALLDSLAEVTQNAEEHQALEDNESMSGTSAVAIDNKIEQAMDLVKSHLMVAVREEVEVLKEKIAELMDRNNQLEAEISILKANATPETLAQISQLATKLPNNNSGSGQ